MSGPTAAPARWPYAEHRNMQQVICDEIAAERRERDRATQKRYLDRKRERAA